MLNCFFICNSHTLIVVKNVYSNFIWENNIEQLLNSIGKKANMFLFLLFISFFSFSFLSIGLVQYWASTQLSFAWEKITK